MSIPGPAALGRGVVINAGQLVPPAWDGAPIHRLDGPALTSPGGLVTALHRAWVDRTPIVVELVVDPSLLRSSQTWKVPPWQLGARFEPWPERLHFLLWANTYDARTDPGAPVWWWARKAARAWPVVDVSPDQPGDVRLADGTPAWIDGGPRSPFPCEELDGLVLIHRESVELGRLSFVPPPRSPRAGLAPDQLAAVGHRSGPARIIAPAGSGKTRVLTERLRHLLVDRGYEREIVLALAYNKKAQQELEGRTADIRPRVQTLNALGYRLLADARGGAPRLLDEREVRRLIERFVPIRRQRANTDPVGPYLEALGQIRLGLRDPEDVEAWRDDVPGLADAFEPYRAAMAEAGALDFDEQIYGAVELLLADGEFRRRAQAGCRHLLVDEFQDLTPAHVLLLRLLASPQLDVFGVGDDDQVIYGHAGADPAFLIDFGELFPGAGHHPLEVNYRCPVPVVEQAAALLSYNDRRVAKRIQPAAGASPAPDSVRVISHPAANGADVVVEVVRGWLSGVDGQGVDGQGVDGQGVAGHGEGPGTEGHGVEPSQIAVLARVNALLLAPQVALIEAGIPVASGLRPEVLERTGLRAALAYLRIAAAPEGAIAAEDVAEILRRPSRGLPQWFADRVRRRSRWSLGQLDAIASQVSDKEASKVAWLVRDLRSVTADARAQGATTRSVLALIKEGIGLGGAMGLLDSSRGGEGSSHLDDLDALEQVAGLHPDVASFESWLRATLAGDRLVGEGGGVTLSTVHRVKGMEWDKVLVFGVNAGILPHRLADDAEEERRVLHVALTRCRSQVVILTDQSRPSPMCQELTGSAPHQPRTASPVANAVAARTGAATAAGRRSAGGPNGGRREASNVDPVAEQALRTWRSERSRRDGLPAFIVLHDRTLLAIASARPATLVALRQVEGIGPAKLDQYGDEILAVLCGLVPGAGTTPGDSR